MNVIYRVGGEILIKFRNNIISRLFLLKLIIWSLPGRSQQQKTALRNYIKLVDFTCYHQQCKMNLAQSLIGSSLAQGPIPKHVALSFDGNRRWAKRHNLEVLQGNLSGLAACVEATKFFKSLGVQELTTYLMSTENFNRPSDQVSILLRTISQTVDTFVSEFKDSRICIVGDVSLLPIELQRKIQEAQEQTEKNNLFTIYLAIAYSSRNEISRNLSRVLVNGTSDPIITMELLDQHFCVGKHKVDLFIRTSGETRLSDLCLWEMRDSLIVFVEKLAPDAKWTDMMKCLLQFQRFNTGF